MDNCSHNKGVYFMADNKVISQTIAFLNSFRIHNRELPLCLIPSTDDFGQIESLKKKYDFSIFNKGHFLALCDDISEKFHGEKVNGYRKLAAWQGEFEQFIYIDIDAVLTDNLSFVWDNLIHCKIFTSQSDLPDEWKQVWKDSIYATNKLNDSQIKFACNTGFIVSSKKTLPKDWVLGCIDKALQLKDNMQLSSMERPFLNYVIVTSGYNYGSLARFYVSNINRGTNREVKFEFWTGSRGGKVDCGRLIFKARPIFLVRWDRISNIENKGSEIPYQELWDYYRNIDILNYMNSKFNKGLNTIKSY